MIRRSWKSKFGLLAATLLLAACGSDTDGSSEPQCADGLTYDPIQATCVRLVDSPADAGSAPTQDAGNTLNGADADTGDAEDLGAPPLDLGCLTDEDGDGIIAMECGGTDCDDTDPRRRPDSGERCDEVDNDCDGEVNEDLDCSLYAHSLTKLFRIDPFMGTADDLGEVPNLNDIDTDPNGTLYGISAEYLYSYEPSSQQWIRATQPLSFTELANGFCIDNDRTAYITTGSTLRVVDLDTGASTVRGPMQGASSSGDCVVNKGNVLFMTSNHTTPDSFVKLDGATGRSTQIGQTTYDGIWGLTAAWGRIFGTTDQGHVVEIDATTGQTTLVHQFQNISFYGAASTPAR